MDKYNYTIVSNELVAAKTYRLVLAGPQVDGEFVNIQIPGYYLRRPISTSNLTNGSPMIPLERLTIATFFIIFLPPHSNCVFAYIRQFYAAFPYGTGLPHARQNPACSVPATLQTGVFSLLPAQGYLHFQILSA